MCSCECSPIVIENEPESVRVDQIESPTRESTIYICSDSPTTQTLSVKPLPLTHQYFAALNSYLKHYHTQHYHSNTNMTRLSIVKSLLSNQRDIRRQTIKVTLNFLTRDQTKQEMSERLGYGVEQLSTWVITYVAYPTRT